MSKYNPAALIDAPADCQWLCELGPTQSLTQTDTLDEVGRIHAKVHKDPPFTLTKSIKVLKSIK